MPPPDPSRTSLATDSPSDTARVAGRLRFAVARMARILRYQDQSGFGPTVVAALSTVEQHGPLTLGELAGREQVAPPTITKVVEKLEASGLLRRTGDPNDRRVTRVAITPRGSRQLQTYRNRRTEWLIARMSELDREERELLEAALPVLERLIAVPEEPE